MFTEVAGTSLAHCDGAGEVSEEAVIVPVLVRPVAVMVPPVMVMVPVLSVSVIV